MLQVYVGVPLEVYIFYDDMYIYIYIMYNVYYCS